MKKHKILHDNFKSLFTQYHFMNFDFKELSTYYMLEIDAWVKDVYGSHSKTLLYLVYIYF